MKFNLSMGRFSKTGDGFADVIYEADNYEDCLDETNSRLASKLILKDWSPKLKVGDTIQFFIDGTIDKEDFNDEELQEVVNFNNLGLLNGSKVETCFVYTIDEIKEIQSK